MPKFKVKVTAWKTFEVEAEDEEIAKEVAFGWFWDDTAVEDKAFKVETVGVC